MYNFFDEIIAHFQGYTESLITNFPKLVMGIIVFSILYIIANRTRQILQKSLVKRMDDPLLAQFLGQVAKIVIVLIGIMFFLRIIGLGDIAAGLITGASVSAIVIGFAFKDIGENFLAGIMLAFNRPFRIGDTVELDGLKGKVISLAMRTTQIKSFDGKDIYIPNASVIKNPVINYTIDGFIRQDFVIGLDYGSDVDKAIEIIRSELEKIEGILRGEKAPSIFISNLGTSTLDITIQYWLDTLNPKYSGTAIKTSAVNNSLIALEKAGFNLPGEIIELKNYNNSFIKTVAENKN